MRPIIENYVYANDRIGRCKAPTQEKMWRKTPYNAVYGVFSGAPADFTMEMEEGKMEKKKDLEREKKIG